MPIKIGNVSNKFFNALLALPKNSDVSWSLSLEEKRYINFILFVINRLIITGTLIWIITNKKESIRILILI